MEDDQDSEYDQMCAICLEKWTGHGEHKALSLHCGHTFGYTCIKRWIKLSKKCPLCNCRTKQYEVCAIFQPSCGRKQASAVESDLQEQRRLANERRARNRDRRAMLRRIALGEISENNLADGASENAGNEV